MGFDLKKVAKAKKPEPVVVSSAGRVWSPQQNSIFDWCKEGDGNLVVRARAGTGKTTTIVEALKHLPSSSVLLCAFNKRIAEELKTRVDQNVHVYTLHALGYRLWRRAVPRCDVDDKRGYRLIEQALREQGNTPLREYKRAGKDLASYGKEMAPYVKKWEELIDLGWAFNVYAGLAPKEVDLVSRAAFRSMQLAVEVQDGTVDYSDMLYLPLQKRMTRGEYDYVVVDEAQDMNKSQLELAQMVLREEGHLIVVGDDRQAIYGFRGADSSSIDRLKEKLKADELGLTVTYRCPKRIVAFANKWVPDLKAADTAPEGVVRGAPDVREAQAGDFIISRLNAPLLKMCLDFVAAGKRAKVEGRDVGRQLQGIIDKLNPSNSEDLIHKIADWERKQVAHAGEDEALAQAAIDIGDAISYLTRAAGDLAKLRALIDSMFEDSTPGQPTPYIKLMTAHKSKGLEADRVFILCETFRGGFNASGGGEEDNLRYVASTRAKKELIFVNPDWPVNPEEEA